MRLGNHSEEIPEAQIVNPSEKDIEELRHEVEGSQPLNPVKCFSVLTGIPSYIMDYFKKTDPSSIKTEGDVRAEEARLQRDILAWMFIGAAFFAIWVIVVQKKGL
ncbi:hypothetical protein GUITHDRAFT_118951 [Guillardia theta CCMP2712]|uniref:Uncharacterized protein n=1 Tax=Guillardia theta (strain CCMP2712) TaxID=905079 RepID=L1IG68_GUITC|nr:hypothetical protein GUITHDRAFT_118951 [Guillardia theta CCMP2712]EKX34909.1 hypothetical protein GUITHDRAFT_118951 [Guillardia theta CCMP2712]|eukprot:XP_005821889.1 hypothetical protein GUITHDRAFT_118951 [Guillardia theta CCMP2712]